MKYLIAQIALIFIQLFRLLPFSVLHLKSKFIAFILGRIIRYRKKVVINNLKRCFPEQSEKELQKTSQQFYLNISDILLESLKGLTISQKEIEKRFKITNPELINQFFQKNQSVICLASHYGNWEWGIQAVNSQIQHQAISIYKPLSNRYLEQSILKMRSRLGMKLYGIEQTKAAFAQMTIEPVAIILAADQSPSDTSKSIIVDFFDERVGFLHGPEAYVSKTHVPVIFFDVQRVKRGFYELKLEVLYDGTTVLKPNELTQKYAHKIEHILKSKPEDWLWSHKRWKHDYSHHPDFIKSHE